jgi:16S rRNA (guanine527-N7)-methyltransferase
LYPRETLNRGGSAEAIEAEAAAAGLPLSGELLRALTSFQQLIAQRAVPAGLISDADRDRIVERHIIDCLRAAQLFLSDDRNAYDLGSGAGLPGIVLAIALPRCRFQLIEPKRRAAGFLELAADRLGLDNVDVITQRAEDLTGEGDVVTARAFASLDRSWEAACRVLRPGGRLIYFAGERFREASAREIVKPEPPAEVGLEAVIENKHPLVIMARAE